MQNLVRVFTQEVPPEIRAAALRGLTTSRLVQKTWASDDYKGSCALGAAVTAVTGMSLEQLHKLVNPNEYAADALKIPVHLMTNAIREWDGLSEDDCQAFVARMKNELARFLASQEPQQQILTPVRRVIREVRELVGA